jgi:hypothetical protein
VAPPTARSPDDGDDTACDLEVEAEAALCKDGIVFDWVPRKAAFEVSIYGARYSSIRVYAIARVIREEVMAHPGILKSRAQVAKQLKMSTPPGGGSLHLP